MFDFGIAQRARAPRDPAGLAPLRVDDVSAFGTPAYMAPEQILGEDVDARSDTAPLLAGRRPLSASLRRAPVRAGGRDRPAARRAPDPARPSHSSPPSRARRSPADGADRDARDPEAPGRPVPDGDRDGRRARGRSRRGRDPASASTPSWSGRSSRWGSSTPPKARMRRFRPGASASRCAAPSSASPSSVRWRWGRAPSSRRLRGAREIRREPGPSTSSRRRPGTCGCSPRRGPRCGSMASTSTSRRSARPIPLPEGTHYVTLIHPSAAVQKHTITLGPGEVRTLDVVMAVSPGTPGQDSGASALPADKAGDQEQGR